MARLNHVRSHLRAGGQLPAKALPARDDIGRGSPGEIARLQARIEKLQNEKRRLEINNDALRREIEELRVENAKSRASASEWQGHAMAEIAENEKLREALTAAGKCFATAKAKLAELERERSEGAP